MNIECLEQVPVDKIHGDQVSEYMMFLKVFLDIILVVR